MAWWQAVLILLGSIAVGLAVGYVVFYTISRVSRRVKGGRRIGAWTPAPAAPPVSPPAVAALPRSAPVARPSSAPAAAPTPASTARPSPGPAGTPSPAPAVKPAESRPAESTPADLITEVDANRRMASGAWNGKLQPFQTRAWDNRGDDVHGLPVDLRDQIAEAYSDMSLANSIVWLATEMGRRSESLDDSYVKLRGGIAGRLDEVYARLGGAKRPVSPA